MTLPSVDDFQIQADEQKQQVLDQMLKKDVLASLKSLATDLDHDAWMYPDPPCSTSTARSIAN